MCGSMPPGITSRSLADTVRAASGSEPGAADQHDASVLDADIGGLGSGRQHAGAAGDGEVEHQVTPAGEAMHAGSPSAKRRRISSGSRSRMMKTSRLVASASGQRSSQRGGYSVCCTAWIAAGPPGAVGELDQALHAQQLLAVLARQAAQRHGEAEAGHRPMEPDRQARRCRGHASPSALGPRPRQRLGRPPNSRSPRSASPRIDDRRRSD